MAKTAKGHLSERRFVALAGERFAFVGILIIVQLLWPRVMTGNEFATAGGKKNWPYMKEKAVSKEPLSGFKEC